MADAVRPPLTIRNALRFLATMSQAPNIRLMLPRNCVWQASSPVLLCKSTGTFNEKKVECLGQTEPPHFDC